MRGRGSFRRWLGIAVCAVVALGADVASVAPPPLGPAPALAASRRRMPLLRFDRPTLPRNRAGDPYPSQYPGEGAGDVRIERGAGVRGGALALELREGFFYAQFNPRDAAGLRGFARDYVSVRRRWRRDTYDRMSLWIRVPTDAMPLLRTGQDNLHVGTYVKSVAEADPYTDETGNNHWYHHFNVAPTGTWTKLVLNMHPDHLRNQSGGVEHGVQAHPTGEPGVNYFDALTRFYVSQEREPPSSYPSVWLLDEIMFYRARHPEADEQVYSVAATYVPEENRLILTWRRDKDENDLRHEVRWAFRSIHRIGWEAASPGGWVSPLGWQGYNGMVWESTAVSVDLRRRAIYLGIRPEGQDLFTEIELPLGPYRRAARSR